MAPVKARIDDFRRQKNMILADERDRLMQYYENKIQQDRAILHARLQREMQFRAKNELASRSGKNPSYGGLLNPPKIGDAGIPSEATLKARQDFKCVSTDDSKPFLKPISRNKQSTPVYAYRDLRNIFLLIQSKTIL